MLVVADAYGVLETADKDFSVADMAGASGPSGADAAEAFSSTWVRRDTAEVVP